MPRTTLYPRAFVYWNVRRKCWSVRVAGRVVAHARTVHMRGVDFVVSEAGRQRVLATGRKNVHAGARGAVVALDGPPAGRCALAVRYNPHRGPHFTDRARMAVHRASVAWLADSTAWCSL